jgi:hypothetical protein
MALGSIQPLTEMSTRNISCFTFLQTPERMKRHS